MSPGECLSFCFLSNSQVSINLTHRLHYPAIDPSIATERIPSLILICKPFLSVPPPALALSTLLVHTFQLYPTCLECFCPRLTSDSCSEGLSWLSAGSSLPASSGYVLLICLLVIITCWPRVNSQWMALSMWWLKPGLCTRYPWLLPASSSVAGFLVTSLMTGFTKF